MVPLTQYEQETIVNFNNEEEFARIYSRSPAVIRKLDSLCEEFPDIYSFVDSDSVGDTVIAKSYRVPKKYITFRKPRILSEKQKKHLDNMRQQREVRCCESDTE